MPKTTCSIETLLADSLFKVPQNVHIDDVITKNNGKQWENADLCGTKQNIHRSKGFDESYSKIVTFIEFEPLCQKLWAFMSNLP